jgi:hypothetical protein
MKGLYMLYSSFSFKKQMVQQANIIWVYCQDKLFTDVVESSSSSTFSVSPGV